MRVLLFGGSGQLGSDILRRWRGDEIVAPSSVEADVRDAEAVRRAIESAQADIVINCTAYNKVDDAERDPGAAFAINALGVDAMARGSAEAGARFVTFSTDYVFDGELGRPYAESDRPSPVSAYGISKYAGELLVERLQSDALIVRVCGLYGTRVSTSKGYTFIDRMIAQAREGKPISVVADQTVSPTFAGHVSRTLRKLIDTREHGVFHMVNDGAVTWHDFAVEAIRQAGLTASVTPVSSTHWSSPARRPRFSALQNTRLQQAGLVMPDWREGIAAYLAEKGPPVSS